MTPQLKQEVVMNAVAITAAGTAASSAIDTLDSAWCTIDIIGTTIATNAQPTVLKLQQSDDTNASDFADLLPFVGGTAVDATHGYVIPAGVTQGTYGLKFNVDMRGKKRYLQVVVTGGGTQTLTAVANLGRNHQSPVTAAKANVLALVEG